MSDYQSTSGDGSLNTIPIGNNENNESGGAVSDGGTSGISLEVENVERPVGDKKRLKPGILRLDISKPRRSSGGSVEFRQQPELLGEVSPSVSSTTSPPQLSVTWANHCDINERSGNSRQMQNIIKLAHERAKRPQDELSPELTSPTNVSDEHNSEEEDYSLSVNAIIQRRASIRGHRKKGHRGSRRTSSPLDNVLEPGGHLGDRRRSSVYTTSSGDTAISFDDGTNQDSTQEQIYENIRLHKEVIQSVKYQPWSIRRKLKLVRQAKTYVARHEGALQERFAMSRSTKDLWARFKILMAARWLHWKREIASFLTVLIPWELRIKEIESHFGSGVASYFTFLRWLLWVNIMIAIPLLTFVIIPELLATSLDHTIKDDRKIMTPGEMKKAGNIMTMWEFEGYLKYSPLFYGFYSNKTGAIQWGYNLPLAYFLTSVGVYIYSFVATLRKMAENSRTSKLSSKDDECVFSWKLFTGWDFMIGHAETAHNRIASVVVGFKEALLEEAEKRKDNRNWRIILQRILVNILVIGLLAASGYTVVLAVDRSERAGANDTWFRRNEVNVIMTLLSFVLPMMFEALGLFENWHPRQQLRLQLARIMILNLLNLYSLMFSFIYKITGKDESLQLLKIIIKNATEQKDRIKEILDNLQLNNIQNITTTLISSMDWTTTELSSIGDNLTSLISNVISSSITSDPTVITTTPSSITNPTTQMDIFNQTQCYLVPVSCSKLKSNSNLTLTTTLLLLNLSSTILPDILTTLSTTPALTTTTEIPTTYSTTTELTITTTEYPEITTFDYTTLNDYTTNEPTTPDYEYYMNNINDSYFFYSDYFDNIDSSEINDDFDNTIDGSRFKRNHQNNEKNLSISSGEEENDNENRSKKLLIENLNNDQNNSKLIMETTTLSSIDIDELYKHITDVYDSLSKSLSNEYGFNDDINIQLTNFFHTTLSTYIENITMINNNQRLEYSIENDNIIRDKLKEYINNVTTSITDNYYDELSTVYYHDYDDGENCTKWICGPITTVLPTQPMDYYDSNGMLIRKYPIVKDEKYYIDEYQNLERTLLNGRKNLSTMCWETSLGQELSKVIVFDAIMSIAAPLGIDFLRALFVRYINDYWCWDMEKTFPQYGDFKIAESILNLVYNQGQVWMGIFFSPGLVIINLVKLIILMYLRSWIVLTCNVPHEVVFKASKSNNFYLSLLLTMLFLCVLPVGYAIVWLPPSWHCGPFSEYTRISEFFTNTTRNALPETLHKPLEYMTSSSTIIPLLLLLILIIYYLVSLTGALREANQDLRTQLQKERMEERKKIFKIPEDKPAETTVASITSRWKRVLESSSPITPTGPPMPPDPEETKMLARKELLSRIMRKALRKASVTSEDESLPIHGIEGDETDTEHHDPLPYDEEHKKRHGSRFPKLHGNRRARKPSLIDIVTMARKDSTTPTTNEPHPKDQYKINRNIVDAKPNDNDPEDNSRIVSERRKSLLRRQPKFGETQSNGHQSEDPNANYEIVNEKNKEMEMKSKQKQSSSKEPNIFKFDGKHDKSEIPQTLIQQKKSLTDVFFKPQSHQTDTVSAPSSPIIIDKPPSSSSFGIVSGGGGEKLAALSRQGKKRIGSFLALVKEAVNKKTDGSGSQSDESKNPSPCGTPESILNSPFQQVSTVQTATPLPPSSKVGKSEQQQKHPQDTIVARSKEQLPPSVSTSTRNGTEKKPHKERFPPKRQDSQTSIPVITISKTGSEECILEYSDKDNDDK